MHETPSTDGRATILGADADRVIAAGASGAALGVVTGMMSQKQLGTLENVVAPLVGSDSVAVGMGVHVAATAVTGAMYGFLPEPESIPKAAMSGAAFGAGVWALGPLLAVHYIHGMPLEWGKLEKMSLVGHVMWGAGLAAASTVLVRRWRERERERRIEREVRGVVPA